MYNVDIWHKFNALIAKTFRPLTHVFISEHDFRERIFIFVLPFIIRFSSLVQINECCCSFVCLFVCLSGGHGMLVLVFDYSMLYFLSSRNVKLALKKNTRFQNIFAVRIWSVCQ